jgi:hypothetical protein
MIEHIWFSYLWLRDRDRDRDYETHCHWIHMTLTFWERRLRIWSLPWIWVQRSLRSHLVWVQNSLILSSRFVEKWVWSRLRHTLSNVTHTHTHR